jgi:hypothetical protein
VTRRRLSKVALVVAAIYAMAAAFALALPWLARPGASLAGVFAVVLIRPWSTVLVWIMDVAGLDSFLFNWGFLMLGAVVNTWLLYTVVAWLIGAVRTE